MEEEVQGKIYDWRLMRRLARYARPYWVIIAISVGLMLAGSLLQVAGPLITKLAVDRFLAPAGVEPPAVLARWLSADPWTGLTQLSILYLTALALGLLFDFGQTYLMQWTGQRAMFDLRRELMDHLQRQDVAFYDRNPVGRLVTRVTTDVDALNELFASGVVAICGDLVVLTFILVVMFQLSPGMTLLLLSVMPLVLLTTVLFRRTVSSSYRRIRVAVAKINAYLQEHVNGIAVLQLFNREERSSRQFARVNAEHRDAFKDAITAYGWFYPVVEFLGTLGLALLLIYGGFRIRSGALTLGVLVAFFQYGMRFFRPIQDLSEKFAVLQSAVAAAERIFGLLDTRPAIFAPARPARFPATPAAIEFDAVWFAYKDDDWVLRDLSFRIEPGETVAVVGHTGAGKTTLTSLLLRFYDVRRGAIRIGGIDIREFDPRELRSQFGVVLQDPYLFTGTVGDNIRLGTQAITDEALEAAAGQVNLLEFIRSLPDGFAQEVRERGNGFSTGQKQLISFARALAHNPRYLILDEATSSVDTETELRAREAIGRLVEGRTSIVIAHRLSTIQRAGKILAMHKGQLRETGTHQELLARRGLYWKLYQLQYKEQEARSLPTP